jgi:hypothetical protein
MKKYDVPIGALVAFAAAKRNAALLSEPQYPSRQLPLLVCDLREPPGHLERPGFREIDADD